MNESFSYVICEFNYVHGVLRMQGPHFRGDFGAVSDPFRKGHVIFRSGILRRSNNAHPLTSLLMSTVHIRADSNHVNLMPETRKSMSQVVGLGTYPS